MDLEREEQKKREKEEKEREEKELAEKVKDEQGMDTDVKDQDAAEGEAKREEEKKEAAKQDKLAEARDWKRNGQCACLALSCGVSDEDVQMSAGLSGLTRRLRCCSSVMR